MNLEEKYGRKYRIFLDDAYKAETTANKSADKWRYLELRGKYGYLYPYSSAQVAVAFTSIKVGNKLKGRAGWKVLQDAEDAIVFLIPDEDIQFSIKALKIYRRRAISDSEKQNLVKRFAHKS